MSRSNKKPKFKDIYASSKANDNFGTLFESMLKSSQYQSLSIGAKQFYTLCRVQARTKGGTSCLYNHGNETDTSYKDCDFVFPASHLESFGINRSNASRYFKELVQKGFIEYKERNKHKKNVNVYSFSNRWQTM